MKTKIKVPSAAGITTTFEVSPRLRAKLPSLAAHHRDALEKLREPTLDEIRQELISRMEVCLDCIESDKGYEHVWCWEFRAMHKALRMLA